jgi:prevent-host-death family protein
MKTTAKKLRYNTKEILSAVKCGEEVIVTYRGNPTAKIVPISNDKGTNKKENALFGIWKDYKETENVPAYVREKRKNRKLC